MRSGVAVGTGLSAALGEPDFRTLFSLAIEPRPSSPKPVQHLLDSDRDAVADGNDECPSQSEDRDGFEDADGCPEDDNDGDGVLDASDPCPLVAGMALQGCPVADTDGDRIPDDHDRCPADAENQNGARDQDGCPERDLDADGLDDDVDACPDVAGGKAHAGCRAHARFAERSRCCLRSHSWRENCTAARPRCSTTWPPCSAHDRVFTQRSRSSMNRRLWRHCARRLSRPPCSHAASPEPA